MPLYYTKQNLYREIDKLRSYIGVANDIFPINIRKYLEQYQDVKIETVSFSTPALRGMVAFGKDDQCDVILLNSHRSISEQNFDCAHEAIHLSLHRNEHKASFTCSDQITNKQDFFLEWHANEGAAELLVPYRDFIPRFVQELHYIQNPLCKYYDVREKLAEFYQVSYKVIQNRIDNLSYEIDQYLNNINIANLQIISRTQQTMRGIIATQYNFVLDIATVKTIKVNG